MRSRAVNSLLQTLQRELRTVLGQQLLGVYLYGSLVWGDFDEAISDIDLLALLQEPIREAQLEQLRAMHERIALLFPDWDNRIEVQYVDAKGLQDFRTKPFPMANISPGEPLHFIPCNKDWLMNWYFVRTYGEVLAGPPPQAVLPEITHKEFCSSVLDQVKEWRKYIEGTKRSRPYQGYAVLTMCRSLYTLQTGQQASKKKAMEWVCREYPQYAAMASTAWQWREDYREETDPAETFSMVKDYVLQMIDDILLKFDKDLQR